MYAEALVPYDLPPDPPLTLSKELARKLDEAMLALGRLSAATENVTPSIRGVLPHLLCKREALMGLAADGRRVGLHELVYDEPHFTTPPDSIQAARNAVEALEQGVRRIGLGEEPTTGLLKRINRTIIGELPTPNEYNAPTRDQPGVFRQGVIWFKRLNVPGRPAMRAPPHLVPELMQALERFVTQRDPSLPALVRTGLAYMQFEQIYPFVLEGPRTNLIYVHLLLHAGGLVGNVALQLSQHLVEGQYQHGVRTEQVMHEGRWETWLLHVAEATIKAAEQTRKLVQRASRTVDEQLERIYYLGRGAATMRRFFAHMLEAGNVTVPDLCAATGLTAGAVRKTLNTMQSAGLIRETTGFSRNRVYRYEGLVEVLGAGTGTSALGSRRSPVNRYGFACS